MQRHRKRRVNSLIKDLRESDDYYREVAARSLGEMDDTRAVQPLIEALNDINAGVREAAAEALGKLGDTRAVKKLTGELHAADPDNRASAAMALINIKPSLETLKLLQDHKLEKPARKLKSKLVAEANHSTVVVRERVADLEVRISQGIISPLDLAMAKDCVSRLRKTKKLAKALDEYKLKDQLKTAKKELKRVNSTLQMILQGEELRPPDELTLEVQGPKMIGNLEKLMSWKEQGLLSPDQFESAKEKLLDK